jgi:hypothetical protein
MLVTRFDEETPARIGRSPAVRAGWKILGALVVAFMLLSGTVQTVVLLAHKEETFVDEFAAEGITTIDVDNASGSVTIRGSDTNRDTITVTSRVSHGLRRTGHREEVEGERLVLDSTCPLFLSDFCRVAYTVEVPTDVDVVARSDGGSITIADVTGVVDVDTDGGGIDVARVDGDWLRMDTDGGSVSAVDVRSAEVEATSDGGGVSVQFAGDPQSVVADSSGGGVEVIMPRGGGPYRVDADSDGGGVDTEVDISQTSDRTVRATSDGGSVSVRYGL